MYLGWSVDDRNQLLQVFRDQSIVEDPVLIAQALKEGILREVVPARLKLVPSALALLVDGVDPVRQAASKPKGSALVVRESGS